jgi:hypothetical protein
MNAENFIDMVLWDVVFCTCAENNWVLHHVCCLFDTFCIAGPGYLTDFWKMTEQYTFAVMVE